MAWLSVLPCNEAARQGVGRSCSQDAVRLYTIAPPNAADKRALLKPNMLAYGICVRVVRASAYPVRRLMPDEYRGSPGPFPSQTGVGGDGRRRRVSAAFIATDDSSRWVSRPVVSDGRPRGG